MLQSVRVNDPVSKSVLEGVYLGLYLCLIKLTSLWSQISRNGDFLVKKGVDFTMGMYYKFGN